MGIKINFVAIFEELILSVARKNKLKREDMVKRVFVFSNKDFGTVKCGEPWSTSFERIKNRFAFYGYEMPELVFWNLPSIEDDKATRPIKAVKQGVSLVWGYSQAIVKVFMDNGSFEEPEEAEEIVEDVEDDSESSDEEPTRGSKRIKLDPSLTVEKAIGNKAYDMLAVYD